MGMEYIGGWMVKYMKVDGLKGNKYVNTFYYFQHGKGKYIYPNQEVKYTLYEHGKRIKWLNENEFKNDTTPPIE